MSVAVGVRVGPYEVLGALGAGGMGEVYRARDTRIGREVALKILPASYADDSDRLRRFEQEARAIGALNHPNLLVLFDVGTHEGSPYLVSELLEGETLRSTLARMPLGIRRSLDSGVQIARGLAAAHEKGIVHRDLKPENLFVTTDGRVKILDFGLARVARSGPEERNGEPGSSDTKPGAWLGTLGYMSPEQVRGQPADHRADMFALGSVLYEMLSGRRAFKGESEADTAAAILHREPPDLSGSSKEFAPGLERILRRCLEKNPAERFQSASDLAFALESLSGTGASAALTRRPAVRPIWPRLLAFVTALALTLLGLAFGKRIWDRPVPSFERLTFQRGRVTSARLAPDGQTVVYAAAWQGGAGRLYSTRVGARESTPLDLPRGDIASISSTGELAILREEGETLARVPLSGGAPRDLATGVSYADWAPDGKSLAIVRGQGRIEYPIGTPLVETEGVDNVSISPQGDRVAFFGTDPQGLGSVEFVDRAGARKVLSTGWTQTCGLTWSPSGDEIWFTAKRAGGHPGWFIPLYAVSLSGRLRLLMSLPSWTHLMDLSREGRVLMTIGSRQNQMFGKVPGAPQERDLAWNESSWATDLSQDGRTLLFQEFAEELYREEGGGLYVRRTDGSPAVRIGQGYPGTLSPDVTQVAVCPPQPQERNRVQLIPVGAGQTRTVALQDVTCNMVQWFPDGKRLLVRGAAPGQRIREYLVDIESGSRRPVTPDGTLCISGSIFPNGRELACREAQVPQGVGFVYSVGGGEPTPVRGLLPGDRINGVRDDHTLSLERDGPRPGGWPAQLFWLDLVTGRRTLFLELQPADPAGVRSMSLVATRDFRSYVYSFDRELNALYFVDGLR